MTSSSKSFWILLCRASSCIKLLHTKFIWAKRRHRRGKIWFSLLLQIFVSFLTFWAISVCKHEPRRTFLCSLLCFALFYCVFWEDEAVMMTRRTVGCTLSFKSFNFKLQSSQLSFSFLFMPSRLGSWQFSCKICFIWQFISSFRWYTLKFRSLACNKVEFFKHLSFFRSYSFSA